MPNLSVPTSTPALVSPEEYQYAVNPILILVQPYRYTVRGMQRLARSDSRVERVGQTYVQLVPVFLQIPGVSASKSYKHGVNYLQSNLAKISPGTSNRRHLVARGQLTSAE